MPTNDQLEKLEEKASLQEASAMQNVLSGDLVGITLSGVKVYRSTFAHQTFFQKIVSLKLNDDAFMAVTLYVACHQYQDVFGKLSVEAKNGSIVNNALKFMCEKQIDLFEAANLFQAYLEDIQKKMPQIAPFQKTEKKKPKKKS